MTPKTAANLTHAQSLQRTITIADTWLSILESALGASGHAPAATDMRKTLARIYREVGREQREGKKAK